MGIVELILLAIGLSMDAAAISATNGMCYKDMTKKQVLTIGLFFGGFQSLMPLLGYYAGSLFARPIELMGHWVTMLLLGVIGGKMVYDGLKNDADDVSTEPVLTTKLLFLQAVATSIDAFAIGVSFVALKSDITFAVISIGLTTFVISIGFVKLGQKIGDKLNSKATIFGGVILILIGVKVVLENI